MDAPTEPSLQTWAQIEAHYRSIADRYLTESEKIKKQALEIEPGDDFKLSRTKINLAKMAAKMAIQARGFYDLADRAKDKSWQDEASERLALLEAEEQTDN